MYRSCLGVLALVACALADCGTAAELPWIELSPDGYGFVEAGSKKPFVPWGFNYDHEGDGRLLEDYWVDDWARVESAFTEMKQLGANIVRIHLQFGRFMIAPNEANPDALNRLRLLVELAETNRLYLDLTGLGCYHRQDVPDWYDALEESERWAAQATFWEAVARACSDSPSIFCYDLMNEPVVPAGNKKRSDWLGPGFADKHFVQFISLDRGGRDRTDIARKWIGTLVRAIRRYDRRHLITVGLVPWSLDRPGLTSGFVPDAIAGDLDFLAVHLYPESGKIDRAIETLRGFAAAGKPVLIEETFPLKCDAGELAEFLGQSRGIASGWIGFYWGRTPEQLRPPATIAEALTLGWLELFVDQRDVMLEQVPR